MLSAFPILPDQPLRVLWQSTVVDIERTGPGGASLGSDSLPEPFQGRCKHRLLSWLSKWHRTYESMTTS
jgi:hypothetical protein